MRDRGRGSPFDHECANPAVGEDLQGMAVVMRQRLTPQSLAYSIDYRADIGYRADRRHSTVPNNSLRGSRTKVILAVASARASVTVKKNLSAVTVAFRLGTGTPLEARCSW